MNSSGNSVADLRINILLTFLVIALIFFLDLFSTPALGIWVLYIIPLFFSPLKHDRRSRIYTSLIITLLLWMRLLLIPAGETLYQFYVYRIILTAVLWSITWLQIQRAKEHRRLLASEVSLRQSQSKLLEAQKLAHMGNYTVYYYKNGIRVEWAEEIFRITERNTSSGNPTAGEVIEQIHPDDRESVANAISEAKSQNKVVEAEYRILTKNRIKYVHIIINPVYESDGTCKLITGTVMDITERKFQELELKKTLSELARSNEDLEQFAYIASHDLQEPLRMISIFTRKLESHFKELLDEKAKEYIWYIVDGSKRMSELIQDLLSYSRISTRSEKLNKTDLNSVIQDVLTDLQIVISQSGTEMNIGPLPVVLADVTQMKQLFQNLIQNAIKFRHREHPLVVISSELKGNSWLFCVKDNGIGISAEHFDRIFMLFQRLHDKEKYQGTGLGLAICKKIVERHGGRIWVESQEGKGTAFFFTIPAE